MCGLRGLLGGLCGPGPTAWAPRRSTLKNFAGSPTSAPAASLKTDGGPDLIELVCKASSSPPGQGDDEESYDYSELRAWGPGQQRRLRCVATGSRAAPVAELAAPAPMRPPRPHLRMHFHVRYGTCTCAGNFRVVVLRKGGTVVSAATLRVFGTKFAELPFITTRKGYRREGHCALLVEVCRLPAQLPPGCRRVNGATAG